jgi:hypothetical protein
MRWRRHLGVVNPATEQRLLIQERAAALLRLADTLEPRAKEANDVC